MGKIIVITGPTATGKTALGVALALRYGGEVVSADSMQIYRRMDIGTAKPTMEERRGVPHHLLDAAEPTEDYSVSRYAEAARRAVDDILSRKRLPLVVGGTGLYIEALLRSAPFAPRGSDGLRAELGAAFDCMGEDAFREELKRADPEAEARIQRGDRKRLLRAMEVYRVSGQPLSEFDRQSRLYPPRYHSLSLALTLKNREALYRRIDRRVDRMMEEGLEEEVRSLLNSGVSPRSTAMQAIGYKEMAEAIRGGCSLSEAVDRIKQGSRRYAKRQLSWLRRDPELRWIPLSDEPSLEEALALAEPMVRDFLEK